MKVIILQNVKGLGQIGDVKNVSDGHARNFLFPRKLAKIATDSAMKEVEGLQKKREAANLKDKENSDKAIAALSGIEIEFRKKASPTGTLFSSVTKNEVAAELSKKAGVKIDHDMIDLGEHGEHIKHIGKHSIKVELSADTSASVTISVASE